MEFVLMIDGTSYGAIGWRPSGFDKTCKRWPLIKDEEPSTREGKSSDYKASSS